MSKDGRKGKDETDDDSNPSNPFPRPTILQRETFKEEEIWTPFDLPRISHLDPFCPKASLQTFLQANLKFCKGRIRQHPLPFHLALIGSRRWSKKGLRSF